MVGIECAKQACEEFFKESQLECITETVGKFTVLKVHTHRNLREPVVTTKLYNVSSLYLMVTFGGRGGEACLSVRKNRSTETR